MAIETVANPIDYTTNPPIDCPFSTQVAVGKEFLLTFGFRTDEIGPDTAKKIADEFACAAASVMKLTRQADGARFSDMDRATFATDFLLEMSEAFIQYADADIHEGATA